MSRLSQKGVHSVHIGECKYCGKKLNFNRFTWDHVYPISRFPDRKVIKLLVPCCRSCQELKADKTLEELIILIKSILTRFTQPDDGKRHRRMLRRIKILMKEINNDKHPSIKI